MLTVRIPAGLDPAERARVRALAARRQARDGQPPLSDQALVGLAAAGGHLLVADGGTLRGYAQLRGDTAELVGDPQALAALLDALPPGVTRAWSHGQASPVAAALAAHGFRCRRVLHQLRRPGTDPVPEVPLPAGVSIRAFRPGEDEARWLQVNAESFAAHPEQGGWAAADLAGRMAEPWFDPAGFLLAERAATLLGFHWTKIHPDGAGEVYVLGVAPAAQGLGLGAALLAAGLRHLAGRGCPVVLLYVDESNTTATRLYQRFGFAGHDVDRLWVREGRGSA